ncbi:solute carrier family 22 member 23 [Brachyhypopomus gauderio]|uniref:solute carrier family 22 member 23 n=1 Tax=Brachyhypopomus gauderio TaxID=698409 RepID=UPI004041F5EE
MAVSQLDTEDHPPENGFVSPGTASPSLLSRIDGCVLPYLGGFGRYQKQLVLLTWIPALFIGFSQFSDNFLLAQPNATCIEPTINGTNKSEPSLMYNSTGNNNDNESARAARFSANGTHERAASLLCDCTRWDYDLQTGLVQNVVTKWNLVCDSAWKVHIAKFSLLVGSIFGYLVLGVLADWFGRHPVLIISVFFTLVFGMTVAFSVDVTMFSTLRFFEGFCLAGITLSLYVLRMELCLPGWRFSMTMVASFVVLAGQLLMPGLAAVCRDWKVLQAFIICPLLLMLFYIWLFPESLRWLLATQQYSRSKRIMERIIQKNQVNRDAEELLTELQRALPKKPKKTCIVKMVGTRNLWKNIVVLCVNSLTGYGIHHCFARSMVDHEIEDITMFNSFYADYYTMAGIAVASCMALCPAVGLMGRRGGLLMFMIITALASLLQLGLLNLIGKYSVQLNIERSDTMKSNFSVAFSIIGMFSSHAVSNLSIFFCAEITPTVIRGGGLGLVLASAGFGMLTAPIMELHNQKGYFLHHVIFACCTLICIICILLLPETRYQALPETLADGETYTRQPLLPPRKPGEQRHLLQRGDSREYARVGTPLHEAAATVISTMESTASSAVDLSVPPDSSKGDTLALCVLKSPRDSPRTPVPNTSTPASARPAPPTRTDSLPDLIVDVQSPAPVAVPPLKDRMQTPPPSGIDHTPSPSSAAADVAGVDSPPDSSSPEMNSQLDHSVCPLTDLQPPLNDGHDTTDSSDGPVDGAVPLHTSTPPVILPPPTDDPPAHLLNDASPDSGHSPVLVNDVTTPTPPEAAVVPLHPAPSSSGPPHPPSSSSPIDSPVLELEPSTPNFIMDSAHLETPSPTATEAPPLEIPSAPLAAEPGHPFTVDLTVSSPIDSGVSLPVDYTTGTANGVASS